MSAPAQLRRGPVPWVLASVAIATAPVLAAAVSVIGRHWHSSGDQGIELLRIADVGSRHTLLTGLWSRLGWSHPGPLLLWLLAPFERAAGETGVLVGVALLSAVAVGAAVVLAARRDGARSAALTALALVVLVHALGPALLVDPWNPWAPVLPFALFLVAAWGVADRDGVLLPVAVGVGSFCVQSHAGYALLVAGVLAVALAVGRGAARRHVVLAAATGLLLWLPPLVQQVTGSPGNLGELLDAARHPTEPVLGWADAIGVLGAQLRAPGPWVTGNDPDTSGVLVGGRVAPALLVLLALVTAAVWSARRGASATSRLCALAAATAALATVSTARQQGLLAPYLVRWWWVVAAFAALALAHAVVPKRAALLGVLPAGALAVATFADLPAPVPMPRVSAAIGAVAGPTADHLDRGDSYLVRGVDEATLHASRVGLFVALERRGFHVHLDPVPAAARSYGRWRLAEAAQVDGVLTITADADARAGWTPPPGSVRVARWRDPYGGYAVWLSDPMA